MDPCCFGSKSTAFLKVPQTFVSPLPPWARSALMGEMRTGTAMEARTAVNSGPSRIHTSRPMEGGDPALDSGITVK